MKNKRQGAFQGALMSALQKLRSIDKSNKDAVWVAILDVLAWLYNCEQAEKKSNETSYFMHRDASPEGRTLAGLIWLRGQVIHHQVEVRELVWVPTIVFKSQAGNWVPVEIRNIKGKTVNFYRPEFKWPKRSGLPNKKPDKRGDDYEMFVQDQDLMPPLEQAARYLISR